MITLKKIGRWMQFQEPIDIKLEKVIDKTLSYTKAGSQFLPNPLWGQIHLYNSKKRCFPCGLMSLVRPILKSWCEQYKDEWSEDEEEFVKPLPVQIKELRPYQKEAFKAFWDYQGGIINSPTSSGKTKISERIIASFPKPNILIICPTKELCKQWTDEFSPDIIKLRDIRIATYQKLYRELSKSKEEFKKYNLIVWDETHHVSAQSLYKIGMNCPNAMMLGLTATVKRADNAEMKIHAVLGDIIYKIPIQDLVKQGYIVQGQVHILETPKYKTTPDQDFRDIYREAIVNNEERNNKIKEIALKEYKNGTVIIVCKQLEQGKILYGKFFSVDKNAPEVIFVNGKSKDRDKSFSDILSGKYDIVICTKIYGEGVSIPRLKTMILASGGKSSTEVIQTTGRMLRLFPNKDKAIIYDFADGCKILSRHFKERLKIYEENGFEVIRE